MYIWQTLCLIQFFILLIVYVFFGLTPSPDTYAPAVNDKIAHFTSYFVAAFSISFAYPQRTFLYKTLFLILFSIGIEIGQHFMPPRTFDLWDICANSGGVLIGLGLVKRLENNFTWFKKLLP